MVDFFKNLMMPLIESVDPQDYSEIVPFMRFCKMLALEELIHAVFMNIADVIVSLNMDVYLKNYSEVLLYSFVDIAGEMQNVLINKFESPIMDISVQNELEYITENEPEQLYEMFKKVIANLRALSYRKGKFGVSKLAQAANMSLNVISGQKIINFLTEYHKKADKTKPKDWIHPSAQNDLENRQVLKNIINELNTIKDYEFQFYMVELFAMMGIKILKSKDKKAGMIEMVFSNSDKCLLSDFELDEIINVAIDHKWLLPTTVKSQTRKILRSCVKLVVGDNETFIFKINPTGKSRCEIVIERIDSDNEFGDGVNRIISILPDTSPHYTYGNSCYRDTNRQKFANVHTPGNYYRRLL
jgi:hypothetical protein